MSHFIPEPRNFVEVAILPVYVRKAWLKETLKEVKILINNQYFIMDITEKWRPVTPCMDVYKEKIQSDESFDTLKLKIVVRGDFQNDEMIGYTLYPESSMRSLKYFL